MDYKQMAKQIVDAVGGNENISGLTHCVTRLRFVLKDASRADVNAMKTMDGVIGVAIQGGQHQVIIGKEVEDVFEEAVKLVDANSIMDVVDEQLDDVDEKKNFWDGLTSTISGIFAPCLPVFAACGVLKGLLSLCTGLHILNGTEGVYSVLYAIADAIFYFFPIIIGASAAEKFKLNKYVGMVIGASMMYPSLIEAASSGEPFTFLGIPMMLSNYSSTVFPSIIAVYLASKLNKISAKICPKTIAYFGVPFLTLTVTVILSLFIVGPLMTYVSYGLATIMNAVYNFSPLLCALLIGGPWIVIVMLGLHWAFIPVFMVEFMQVGYSSMMGLLGSNQFAVAGSLLAVGLKSSEEKMKNLGISTGVTCLLGISEPGIYGVLLPLKKPFVTSIIAGSLGAIPGALLATKVYAAGASGIFGFPSNMNPAGVDAGFYGALLQAALGFALGFVLTYLFAIPKKEK